MRDGEIPIPQALYYCYSRNAILRCRALEGEFFIFERVISMSCRSVEQLDPGYEEQIHQNNLAPLVEINEMEALAYASR